MQVNNGSNQTTIISFKKKKNCLMCNKLFEYTQPTTKYCSNACKCRAYSIRVKAGQRVQRIPKTAEEISLAHEFNDQDTNSTLEEQIEQLKNYVVFLHQQIQIIYKEQTANGTKPVLGAVVFSNVRESKLKKSMRKRQCFKCEGKIEKGETYMNHQFRYDYRIITVSFCNNCT